jgi:hypothetical protein
MVAEARDSLVDAAESYQDAGLAPVDARRRAVAEFGWPAIAAQTAALYQEFV